MVRQESSSEEPGGEGRAADSQTEWPRVGLGGQSLLQSLGQAHSVLSHTVAVTVTVTLIVTSPVLPPLSCHVGYLDDLLQMSRVSVQHRDDESPGLGVMEDIREEVEGTPSKRSVGSISQAQLGNLTSF